MSRLILVRHGETLHRQPEADQLSDVGQCQAQRLGCYWAERGMLFDQVYVGPRRRHHQTHDAVAEEYLSRGLPWPAPIETRGLDEYAGFAVVKKARPEVAVGTHVPADYRAIYKEVTQR